MQALFLQRTQIVLDLTLLPLVLVALVMAASEARRDGSRSFLLLAIALGFALVIRLLALGFAASSKCLLFDISAGAQALNCALLLALGYGAVRDHLLEQRDAPLVRGIFGFSLLGLALIILQCLHQNTPTGLPAPGWLPLHLVLVVAACLIAWKASAAIRYYNLAARIPLLTALWALVSSAGFSAAASSFPVGQMASLLLIFELATRAVFLVAVLIAIYLNVLAENQEHLEARHEAELYSMQEQKGQAIANLASVVAHEMNNPLTAIMLHADVMLTRFEDGPEAKSLGVIRSEVSRLRGLTQSLGQLSRPSRFTLRECDLGALLGDMALLAGEDARRREIILAFTPPSEPLIIEADSEQLRQVFLNLIQNAIQAVESSGEIHLELVQKDREAVVTVSDNGPGIASDKLGKLFEPFFTTKQSSGGTGLGLYVSKRIIEKTHRGRLEVESSPGKGAKFIVSLPLTLPAQSH